MERCPAELGPDERCKVSPSRRALTFATRGNVREAEDVEGLSRDEQVLRDLVDGVLRLAGVDHFGRPVAAACPAASHVAGPAQAQVFGLSTCTNRALVAFL